MRCVATWRVGDRRSDYTDLVGKPDGKIPLGRCRNRWEENIKMDLQLFKGGEVGAWLIRLRIGTDGAGFSACGNEPLMFHKIWEFLDYLRTSWRLKKNSAPWNWLFVWILCDTRVVWILQWEELKNVLAMNW